MQTIRHFSTFRALLMLCIFAGILLRLALVIVSGWRMDYDEAMIGLLGLRVLRGEFMAFIPAQATLGAFEAYLLAPLFAVFGANAITFRIVGLVFSAGYIATTGLLGYHAFSRRVGILATLLAAFAPPYMLITGLKTWGGTIETMVFGNVLFLLIAHALKTQSWRYFALAGLIAGVMFWVAWLGFYYFVPVALVFLLTQRRKEAKALRNTGIMLVGFIVGSSPFWIHNLQQGFPTFSTALGGERMSLEDMRAVFAHFRADLMPRLVSSLNDWGSVGQTGRAVLVVLYFTGAASLVAGAVHRRNLYRWLLAIFVLTVPALFVVSTYGRSAFSPYSGSDPTGRYVVMLHSALPIGLAALAVWLWRRRYTLIRWAGVGLIGLTLVLNVFGVLMMNPLHAFNSPYYARMPDSLDPLIEFLDANNISHIWTDVGIAHVLMFETNERIIAADYWDAEIAGGLLRFPDAFERVLNAERTAFVVPILPEHANMPIQQALDAAGIAYTRTDVLPTLAVFIPSEQLDPAVIAAGLGYQY